MITKLVNREILVVALAKRVWSKRKTYLCRLKPSKHMQHCAKTSTLIKPMTYKHMVLVLLEEIEIIKDWDVSYNTFNFITSQIQSKVVRWKKQYIIFEEFKSVAVENITPPHNPLYDYRSIDSNVLKHKVPSPQHSTMTKKPKHKGILWRLHVCFPLVTHRMQS